MPTDDIEVRIEATFLHATQKARLIEIESEEVWIPKSLSRISGRCERGGDVDVVIPLWFAKDRGITDYSEL